MKNVINEITPFLLAVAITIVVGPFIANVLSNYQEQQFKRDYEWVSTQLKHERDSINDKLEFEAKYGEYIQNQ